MNNPYIAGAPLRAGKAFFGRQDILQWAMQELRNPASNALVLFGQRRIGKTSLLLQLQGGLPREAFLPVYFDLQDQAKRPLNQMLLDLVDTITERAGVELPKPSVPDERGVWFRRMFLPEFYQKFGEARRLVFLFDEFDVLDQAAQANLPTNAAANAFFEFLRRLMGEDPRPAFVFVVGRRAEDMNIDFTATFKSSLVREVWTLDADSAGTLVRQAEANGSLKFSDDAVGRILALTNSHPYLTQLLCQRIWERAYLDEPETAPAISATEVENAVPDALESGNQALVWLWNGLAPAEKIYASALAEASTEGEVISEDRVIQTITEHATRLRTRDVELAPRDLVRRRVLEANGPRDYRFAVELFRRWVAVNKPLREVKDELDQVDPLAEQLFSFGVGFFKRQQWQLAARYFTDALQNNPRHFRARLNLGEALLEMKKTDEAVAELEGAYDLDQDEARLPLARALIEQAKIRDRANDDEAAVAALDRALLVSPNEAEARRLRTLIFTRRGDSALTQKMYDQAIEAYREAGLPEKISQAEAWRKREALNVLEKQADENVRQRNWAAAAEAYQELTQQAEDTESLVVWEKKLTEVRAEQDLAELFTEGATALAERNYTRAQTALQKVVAQKPDYRSNGQTAERLLQRAITEDKQRTLWQRVSAVALNALWVVTLVVVVTWAAVRALTPLPTPTPPTSQPTENPIITVTPQETVATPLPGTTVAPTAPTETSTPEATPTSTPPPPQILQPSNVEQVAPLARLGKGSLLRAVYSPDGRLLAVTGSLGIYLYDANTLEELSLTETRFRDSLAWAPDGQTLVSASENESVVQRWQVVNNALALQGSLLGHTVGVRALAFDGAGRLAAAGFSKEVSLWNVGDDQRARAFPIDGEAESVAFSPDGQWLAVGRKDGVIRVFNTNAQDIESQRFTEHTGEVRALAFSPDSQWLASGGHSDNLVIVRDVTTREEVARWETFNGNPVRALSFAPDGERLAVGSFVAVEVFALSNPQAPAVWKQLALDISSLTFSPDGQTLITTAQDGVLRQWQAASGAELEQRLNFMPIIKSVIFAPAGGLLATGHEDGSTRIWNLSDSIPHLTLNQNLVTPATRALAFSPDGTLLATGDYQKVKIWQAADGTLRHELTGFNSTVYAVAFSPDGTWLAAASEDGIVQVWDTAQPENPPVLQHGIEEPIRSLAFSADGRYLAAGHNGRVHVWQTNTWDESLYALSAEGSDAVIALAFSPDSQILLITSEETDLIQRWGLEDGERLEPVSVAGEIGTLLTAAFSPGGQLLVGGISEGTVVVWNATTGEQLGPLNGHLGAVYDVAFSPDGRWLASAGYDGTLRLWGVPAGAP